MDDKIVVHNETAYFIRVGVKLEGLPVDGMHHLSYRAAHINQVPQLGKMAVLGSAEGWALYG